MGSIQPPAPTSKSGEIDIINRDSDIQSRSKILSDDQISIRKAQNAINHGLSAVHTAYKLASKRGLAWSWKDTAPEVCLYHDAATARKINWLFNFDLQKPEGLPHGIEFVPQARSVKDAPQIDTLLRALPEVTHLLGFKEPEKVAIPVEEAVALWKQYILPAKTRYSLTIGSPSTSNTEPSGNAWLQRFLSQLDTHVGGQDGVDFIVVHWLGSDVYALKVYLADIHERFGKPLWLTQLAYSPEESSDGTVPSAPAMMDKVEEFMREAIPFLDRCPYVERYAYFGAMQFVDWAGGVEPYADWGVVQ